MASLNSGSSSGRSRGPPGRPLPQPPLDLLASVGTGASMREPPDIGVGLEVRKAPSGGTIASGASELVAKLSDVVSVRSKENELEFMQATNEFAESWFDFLTLRGSVLKAAVVPASFFTLWGLLWTLAYVETDWRTPFPNSQAFISIISFVVALILGYRTNAAYDRYWEARKVWGTLVSQSRNLARGIWCSTDCKGNPQFERERLGAINLILAFSVSTKHLLRDEVGHNYTDLAHLLVHVPKFQPGTKNRNSDSIPIDIVVLLTEYVRCAEENAVIDGTTRALLLSYIAGLIESLTNFERIRNTPIPLAYAIHLKHILVLFLLSLPFQLPQVLGWLTVPVILIASVTLLGIEGISTEIEQPFGYDHNDLRMNEFCNELRMELYNLTRECDAGARGVDGWKLSGIVRDTEFRKRERVRRTTEFGLSDFAAKVEVEVAQVMKGT